MKVEKIAVLGAGNGGITAAADLSSRGFKVNLYQMPGHEKSLKAIKEKVKFFYKIQQEIRFVKLIWQQLI